MVDDESNPPQSNPPWRATLDDMTRDALESLCAVAEDASLPDTARSAAAQHLIDASAEGRVPADLLPRVTGALGAKMA